MTVMSRKDVEGKPWIDMIVRLEKAQGIRRVYFHFTGVSPQYAAARNAPILPRWLVPVPKKVAFESYLDPFGHDGYGREKYRLRRRLRDPVRPNFFEVNKRRDQIPYPRDECIEVEIDTTKEQEVSFFSDSSVPPLILCVSSPFVRYASCLGNLRCFVLGATKPTTDSRRSSMIGNAPFVLFMYVFSSSIPVTGRCC